MRRAVAAYRNQKKVTLVKVVLQQVPTVFPAKQVVLDDDRVLYCYQCVTINNGGAKKGCKSFIEGLNFFSMSSRRFATPYSLLLPGGNRLFAFRFWSMLFAYLCATL